jgi:AraC-like DNA-binding protein
MTRSADQWATPPKVPHDHYVSALVYSDPDIFREEQEKIFKKVWKLACHDKGSVASVALQCGFPSLGGFERAFRKRFGEAPSPMAGERRPRRR